MGEKPDAGDRIDRYLCAVESFGFSGAIVVEHKGEVALRKGYGLADRDARQRYTPTTVQSHGSITKQMTAAAILLLDERGSLSVHDTLDKHFENLPAPQAGITLHQLLTHSSGLTGGFGPDEEPIDRDAFVTRLMAEPLAFEPGEAYGYSNAGYSLLGIIVERVSGEGYEPFLRDALLTPAGLHDTGYLLPRWETKRLASGYLNGEPWGRVYRRGWREDGPGWHLRANGGLHTTVDDMHRWLDVVRGRRVFDEQTARRWTAGYVEERAGGARYGYGWRVGNSEWGDMISHSGSNRIFSADFVWLPERDFFFYIQGNTSMDPAHLQRSRILAAAFDPDFPMPPLVEAYDEAKPQAARPRAGTYPLPGGSLELMTDDTRLVAKLWGQAALDLLPGPSEAERTRFAELNRRAHTAMVGLESGKKDALASLVGEDTDPVEATRPFLQRIERIGDLQKLHVIGTFANGPGSRFARHGPWTTFVYAEFENWNQYWNLVWSEAGIYLGNASGPWPSFTLVPLSEDRYRAVQQEPPWHGVDLRFEAGCLVGETLRTCPKVEVEG